jgi:ferric-chelate reductase
LHNPAIVPYVLAAGIIYGVDHLIRLAKVRVCTARIKPFPELETTHLQIRNLNAGWRAGQHVRLRILSSGLGWWGWTENHPFTIASIPNTEDGLVLMIKHAGEHKGSWTTKLYEMAKASGYGESGKIAGRRVKVMIDGPYGWLSYRRCYMSGKG